MYDIDIVTQPEKQSHPRRRDATSVSGDYAEKYSMRVAYTDEHCVEYIFTCMHTHHEHTGTQTLEKHTHTVSDNGVIPNSYHIW